MVHLLCTSGTLFTYIDSYTWRATLGSFFFISFESEAPLWGYKRPSFFATLVLQCCVIKKVDGTRGLSQSQASPLLLHLSPQPLCAQPSYHYKSFIKRKVVNHEYIQLLIPCPLFYSFFLSLSNTKVEVSFFQNGYFYAWSLSYRQFVTLASNFMSSSYSLNVFWEKKLHVLFRKHLAFSRIF